MGTISRPNSYTSGTVIKSSEVNSDFNTIYNQFNGNIDNANIKAAAGIVDTKLAQITTASKVSLSALVTTDDYTGTGDWTLNGLLLPVQASSVSTGASQGAIYTKDIAGQAELFYHEESNGTEVQITNGGAVKGSVIQSTHTITADSLTTTVTIPQDNTKPQNTEGTELSSVTITPTSLTTKLRIDVVVNASHTTASSEHIVSVFQDAGADAIVTGAASQGESVNQPEQVIITYWMASGTVAATTFTLRGGSSSAGRWTMNGSSTAGRFGGTYFSGITVTEYS